MLKTFRLDGSSVVILAGAKVSNKIRDSVGSVAKESVAVGT